MSGKSLAFQDQTPFFYAFQLARNLSRPNPESDRSNLRVFEFYPKIYLLKAGFIGDYHFSLILH